ncbi:MAG: LruC domain-containing protein [Bacteroidales bacterium]|nr:LruC domain-containing protein [Bacteroidales bacterium]
MKKYLSVVLLVVLISSCNKWEDIPEQKHGDAQNIDELVVTQDFNWSTSENISFSIKNAQIGIIKISTVDEEIVFHKGNYNGTFPLYNIDVHIPDYVSSVCINSVVVPIIGNTVYLDFNDLKSLKTVDYYLDFDGINDYVEIDETSIINNYPFTMCAWIKTNGFSDPNEDMVIINIAQDNKTDRYYGIFIGASENGKACIRARKGSHKTKVGTTILTDSAWHFVVGVFANKNNRKLYVDGVLEASDTRNTNFESNADATVFGRWGDSTPKSYFHGDINDIQLWDIALTLAQITSYYNNSPTGNESGLVGFWKFDTGSGSTVYDETDEENDGTINGALWDSDSGGSSDSDGDGVNDENDDYPQDATRALDNYFPASSFGSLAFEDLWPAKGDYDFNDLVINYQFKTVTNASNYVVEIFGTFTVEAIGASYQNGFGFQFPNDYIPNSNLTVTGYDLQETGLITLLANGTEANQSKNTIIVFDNAFNILPNTGGELGSNTDPNGTYVVPDTVTITMDFANNTYTENDIGISNFNPFIYIDLVRGKEIHLVDNAPTDLVDTSYFNTLHDNSNSSQGRYYKTVTNLPWVINIYESFDYPVEKTEILQAHLKFGNWAESSGANYPDWYQDISGYRNDAYIY